MFTKLSIAKDLKSTSDILTSPNLVLQLTTNSN